MPGLIITVQPSVAGWQVTVWEGCFSLFHATCVSFSTAQAAGETWVALHRPGAVYLVEIASVPDEARH